MGLSLMTPIGRFILNLLENSFGNLTIDFYVDFIGSVILLLIGLCFIQRGYEIADERDK
jgi:hypothetical protein